MKEIKEYRKQIDELDYNKEQDVIKKNMDSEISTYNCTELEKQI